MSRCRASREFGRMQTAPWLSKEPEYFSDLARIAFQHSKSTSCQKKKKKTWGDGIREKIMIIQWDMIIITLGEKSSVRYTALEFNSDMVNGGSISEWKYFSPRAIPITIFILRVHDNWHPSPSEIRTSRLNSDFTRSDEKIEKRKDGLTMKVLVESPVRRVFENQHPSKRRALSGIA